MKEPNVFIVLLIFVSVLPSILEAMSLPRTSNDHRSIQNFIQSPLQMIGRNLVKEKYENTNVRKSNPHTIPVYIIMGSKRIVKQNPVKLKDLFNDQGMIFITNPKRETYQQVDDKVSMDYIGRRNHSGHNVDRKNERALRSLMNQELNRQILAKTVQRRLLENFDKEYNFNDLVM